jgi:hypothetical protein
MAAPKASSPAWRTAARCASRPRPERRLRSADPGNRQEIACDVERATADMPWVPNPGPQSDAYRCEADELFYGGQAGGGKTDLGLGLALTAHKRSLILRRIHKDAVKLVERVAEILGNRDGYNGQLQRWKLGHRVIEFAGCEHEDDKQRFKGDPHDLIYFDEGTDFVFSQYRFIIGWNRSAIFRMGATSPRILCMQFSSGKANYRKQSESPGALAVATCVFAGQLGHGQWWRRGVERSPRPSPRRLIGARLVSAAFRRWGGSGLDFRLRCSARPPCRRTLSFMHCLAQSVSCVRVEQHLNLGGNVIGKVDERAAARYRH